MSRRTTVRIGETRYLVEWVPDAAVPQAFKDDEDRDLAEVMQWEKRRAFPSKPLAMKFAKSLRDLFFGVSTIRYERFDIEFPEVGPEWVLVDVFEVDAAE